MKKNRAAMLQVAAAVSAALASGAAVAADAPASQTLDRVEVTAAAPEDYTYSVNGVETDLSPFGTTIRETPQSFSVLSSKEIEEQNYADLADAMRHITGVNVTPNFGANSYVFWSRGFQMNQLSEDGVSGIAPGFHGSGNSFADGGMTNDLAIYDRIEVLRGPSGLIQGMSEPGGTVNMVRKKPLMTPEFTESTSVGSYHRFRQTVDLSRPLNAAKTLRGRVVMAGDTGKSIQDSVSHKEGTFYGVIEADLTPRTKLDLGALYMHSSRRADYYGVPLFYDKKTKAITDSDLPRSKYYGADWNRYRNNKVNLFGEFTHSFNDDWKVEAHADWSKTSGTNRFGRVINSNGITPTNTLLQVGGQANNAYWYDLGLEEIKLSAKLDGHYRLFGHRHEAFIGASYAHSKVDTDEVRATPKKYGKVPAADYRPWMLSEPDWSKPTYNRTYKPEDTEAALNIGTRYELIDPVHILIGGRLAHFKSEPNTFNHLNNKDISGESESKTKFIPYAGITWDIVPNLTAYASYTDIYQPAGLDENNKVLKPVTGEQYEAGVKADLFQKKASATFAVFRINQKDRVVNTWGYDAAGEWFDHYENGGKVKSQGFEFELTGEVLPFWNVTAGYTYNHSEYEDDEGSVKTRKAGMLNSPHTARHIWHLSTTYRLPFWQRRIMLMAGMRGQSRTTSTYNAFQGGYSVWDFGVSADLTDRWNLRASLYNAFDKKYYENYKNRTYYLNNVYGDPRTLMVTLTGRF